jgi:hypothetical protein
MTKTITKIAIGDLVPADWNYKGDATEGQLEKLARSIQRDESAGVLPVREIDDGKYEVIDGNHRLEAIRKLGWIVVTCENFGAISIAEAIALSRRRNKEWFEDDPLKLAAAMNEYVFPEIDMKELETFMPESMEELENYKQLAGFDWEQPELKPHDGAKGSKVVLVLSEELAEAFSQKVSQIKLHLGDDGDEAAIAAIMQVLKNIPLEEYE